MFDLNQMYRKAVLGIAHQRSIERLIRTRGRSIAQRFIAGDTLKEALAAVEHLQKLGIHSILDLLGEMVTTEEQAKNFTHAILESLSALQRNALPVKISIKLSQIGQDITLPNGENLGMVHAKQILSRAQELDGFVCLDMEDHTRTDLTLKQFRELHKSFGNHLGTVLQAYLYRTEQDQKDLQNLSPHLRIVKGAYLEPESHAYSKKSDVDIQYRRLVYTHMDTGHYTCIATHDERLIQDIKHFVKCKNIPKDRFEFQMLYGIRQDIQTRLTFEGYTVRAYIPYGEDWYAYFSRRIAERPANLTFVLHGMLRG